MGPSDLTDLLIRPAKGVEALASGLGDEIFTALSAPISVSCCSNQLCGSAVGDELAEDGGLALLTALLVVMIYILFRFTKQFSVCRRSMAHDVVIVLGCFSVFAGPSILRYLRRYWR